MIATPGSNAFKTDLNQAPWLAHYPQEVPAQLDYPSFPAWGFLAQTAEKFPRRTACHYYSQEISYAELAANARKTAAMLVGLGVKPGDRVGILLPNVPEYLSILNGIWMAGGVAVALSPLMVAEEVSSMIDATDCKIVVCLDLLAPLVLHGEKQPDHVLFTTLKDRLAHWQRFGYAFAKIKRLGFRPMSSHANLHCFNDVLEEYDADFEPVKLSDLNTPAFILPTGGTTGAPKAVTLSHRNLVANAWQLYHWGNAREGKETMLAVVPFFHSYGLSTCALTGVAMGATMVLHHRFIPRVVIRLMEQYQPSIFNAVPAMLSALNEIFRTRPLRNRCMQFCISGGAPLDMSISEEFSKHTGGIVVEGFGLSEASPVTHVGPLDGTNRAGTIGLPLPDTEVRIVDADTGTRIMPPGEVGELIVRGPQVMLGYWKNQKATDDTIRDGWLFTGDLATCDQDGFFTIVDRKKDLIITSGFNVYPNDVEQTLRQFDQIEDVAIVGVSDAEKGQLVKAVLVPCKGTTVDLKAFDRFAKEHLAKHKRPRIVEVLSEDLPRNFLGKVQRRHLRPDVLSFEDAYRELSANSQTPISVAE